MKNQMQNLDTLFSIESPQAFATTPSKPTAELVPITIAESEASGETFLLPMATRNRLRGQ